MGVSYEKNKIHILKWRDKHLEQISTYNKVYKKEHGNDKNNYQAKYRMYKRECNRLQNIDI